jgi:hypothetical protein
MLFMLQVFHEQAQVGPGRHARRQQQRAGMCCNSLRAGGQELHALFFDFFVITRSNSSPISLF